MWVEHISNNLQKTSTPLVHGKLKKMENNEHWKIPRSKHVHGKGNM
jgi:hypothetical protein